MSDFNTNLDAQTVDTMKETDKKCPSCGGVMNFDPATGGLSCPYCGYVETIAAKEEGPEFAEELDISEAEKIENCNWGVNTKTVLCQACGAESIYDSLQISAVCPFCGSNQVMEASDKETMAPGGVVPFQITDKQASELFLKWIKKKWFCPKMAKESAKAKSFKGIYLPYWTFDADTVSEYRGDYGKDREVKQGDEKKVVTDWYPTRGTYKESIDDELIIASNNHNQSMLRGLEPFDTAANKKYKPEYIAGFVAERYAVGIKEAWKQAREAIKNKVRNGIEKLIKQQHNADRVRNLEFTTAYHNVTYKYLMLPIWISNYKYQDKVYHFMVNGQTGKVSGKTPISVIKVVITAIAAVVAIALIAWLYNNF